jgi:hypothetical protein
VYLNGNFRYIIVFRKDAILLVLIAKVLYVIFLLLRSVFTAYYYGIIIQRLLTNVILLVPYHVHVFGFHHVHVFGFYHVHVFGFYHVHVFVFLPRTCVWFLPRTCVSFYYVHVFGFLTRTCVWFLPRTCVWFLPRTCVRRCVLSVWF